MTKQEKCIQTLSNGEMKSYLPINIEMDKIKNNHKSVNLSKFEYDFKEVSKVTVEKLEGDFGALPGILSLSIDDTITAKFSTMGNVVLVFTIFTVGSVNLYDGERMDGELFLIFKSIKNNKYLCLAIPVKKTTGKSKQTNWFSQFGDIVSKESNSETVEVNNFTLNDIIPESEFIYYPEALFAPFGCDNGEKCNFIIYPKDKAINIKNSTYNSISSAFGRIERITDISSNSPMFSKISWCDTSTNHKECMKVNEKAIYFNPKGTRAGPGFNLDSDVSAMTCEPIVDENDEPIDGRLRLSWLKSVALNIPESVRNSVSLIILSLFILGILLVIHDTVFNKLGILIGTDKILDRHTIK